MLTTYQQDFMWMYMLWWYYHRDLDFWAVDSCKPEINLQENLDNFE